MMSLTSLLSARVRDDRPLRIGIVGVDFSVRGFLSAASRQPGFHIVALAADSGASASRTLLDAGWPSSKITTCSMAKALAGGQTLATEDAARLIDAGGLEIVVIAEPSVPKAVSLARAAVERGRHVIMLNALADALVGPLLARDAIRKNVIYSLGSGSPAAIACDLVDWARLNGLEVTSAGFISGRDSTTGQMAQLASLANATGLTLPDTPNSCVMTTVRDLLKTAVPKPAGGQLSASGQLTHVRLSDTDLETVEFPGSMRAFAVYEAPTKAVRKILKDQGAVLTSSGVYGAHVRTASFSGVELGVSIAQIGLLGAPAASPRALQADLAAEAAESLKPGEAFPSIMESITARLLPARKAQDMNAVPLGLLPLVTLKQAIRPGRVIRWEDVEWEDAEKGDTDEVRLYRREMESLFLPRRSTVTTPAPAKVSEDRASAGAPPPKPDSRPSQARVSGRG